MHRLAHPGFNLVADIGGTNARFAIVERDGEALSEITVLPVADYPGIEEAIADYTQGIVKLKLERVCLAVASPLEDDRVDMLNSHWVFSQRALQRHLGIPLTVINDFTAQILGTYALVGQSLQWFDTPRPRGGQVRAIIGAGTGLGVAAMTPSGDVIPSEGGHVAFAPVNAHEAQLLTVLWRRFERVSLERVLSGAGLSNLYWANSVLAGEERELTAAQITAGAHAGDDDCLRAVADFCAIAASAAGDLAISMGAADGVFLSGGILPRLTNLLDPGLFRRQFADKGRLSPFCEQVPLALVLAEQPGLLGCVQALKRELA
jgi:glucokinase